MGVGDGCNCATVAFLFGENAFYIRVLRVGSVRTGAPPSFAVVHVDDDVGNVLQ
jgi:hypothetical protein